MSSAFAPAPAPPRLRPGHQVSGSFNLLCTGLAAWVAVHSLFCKYEVL